MQHSYFPQLFYTKCFKIMRETNSYVMFHKKQEYSKYICPTIKASSENTDLCTKWPRYKFYQQCFHLSPSSTFILVKKYTISED